MKDLKFILTYNGTATTLINSPDGWDDVLVKYERSTKYLGLFRSYSIPLRFLKEGATILRQAFYTDGHTAEATLTIQKLNRATMHYYTAYTASFDFATFKDYRDFVDIMVVEGGLSAFFKKHENTQFEITNSNGFMVAIDVPTTPSSVKFVGGINFIDLFTSIAEKMTDGRISAEIYAVSSSLLTAKVNETVLVNTEVFDTWNANATFRIKTSLSDFFKSLNALYSIGIGMEVIGGIETLVLREKSYFLQNTEIAAFTSVNDFELSIENSLLFNVLKVGYHKNDYRNRLTINEANTTTEFTVKNSGNIVTTLDLTSVYRADHNGLLDMLMDDETGLDLVYYFQKVILEDDYYTLYDAGQLKKKDIAGTVDFQNAEISPKRLLSVHTAFIESCLNINDELIYSTAGNDNLNNETRYWNGSYFVDYALEYEGITIEKATSMFVPYILKVDVPLSFDLNSVLSLASTGYISILFEGNTYKGFLMSAGVKLAGRGVVELKLLASYDNDFSTLIR